MKNKQLLASLSITLSTLIVAIKLLAPSSLQIVVQGEEVAVNNLPRVYFFSDIIILTLASITLGGSTIYLLQDMNRETAVSWDNLLDKTNDQDEQTLLQLLIDNQGTIFQGEIVEQTGFSKSKVSLLLDRLEARKILERKRHGMSNVVVLKQSYS